MKGKTNEIETAIILAAGLGVRLNPLTNTMPKCLVEINGVSILENALANLERNGIRETVVVVGYLKNEIRGRFGFRFGEMRITYIENKVYDKTNNMYSLWLAREYLQNGVIWMDGDIFFEEKVLKKVLEFDEALSCWAVDNFTEEMDGAMLTADISGKITNIEIVRLKSKRYKNIFFKSAGILKMNAELGLLFSEWLNNDVKRGNVNIYCDIVLAQHLDEYPIFIRDIEGLKWCEIDDYDDLERARRIFKDEKQ